MNDNVYMYEVHMCVIYSYAMSFGCAQTHETIKLRRTNWLWLIRMVHLYIYAHNIVSDILSSVGRIIVQKIEIIICRSD